ncbi:hypothetical protein AUJ14_01625 [Candidatus Micrarchaeota archaeon CG1_02_55_22]|nr:MAG: hypothetical protein AUJ14_01625 [Candidatus Micrarchaeota archaeon CG1_02_55_22]
MLGLDLLAIILAVTGLAVFEITTSIDNAVINADVLRTMSKKARHWFLVWGLFIAVFLVRGLLPLLIVYSTNPQLGILGALTATFSNDPAVITAIELSKPLLLLGGGVFLLFLFLHWLFLEPKSFGLKSEKKFFENGLWFYTVAAVLLAAIVWFAIQKQPLMAFSAVVGSTAYFIMHGFKQNAAEKEKELLEGNTHLSDFSKILYLEVIDASFSIDGVLGAFAFTLSVPLILIGNGIGAVAVREMTIRHIETVKKYKYLKNGAMYSVLVLGIIMTTDAFGAHIPEWLSPISTFIIIGYFFYKSKRELDAAAATTKNKIKNPTCKKTHSKVEPL